MHMTETETPHTPSTRDPSADKLDKIRTLLADEGRTPDAVLDSIAAILDERGPIYQKSWG